MTTDTRSLPSGAAIVGWRQAAPLPPGPHLIRIHLIDAEIHAVIVE